jgi:hypothetical protein
MQRIKFKKQNGTTTLSRTRSRPFGGLRVITDLNY